VAKAWAPLMFAMLKGAESCAVLLANSDSGPLKITSNFPVERLPGARLISAAEGAMNDQRGMVRGTLPDGSGAADLVAIAVPLILDDTALGAVAVELRPTDRAALQQSMRQLQWGAAWLRDALRSDFAQQAQQHFNNAVDALHVVGAAAEQQDFAAAARAAVTDLANRFGCDRVSIGFRSLRRTKVAAISHSAQFGRQMNFVSLVAAAMDEAIDQRGVVIWPDDDVTEPMATHRHEKLAKTHSIGHLLTCPLYVRDKFVGAVLFERPSDRPFTQNDAETLEAAVTVLSPVIDERRSNDRWLITRAAKSFGNLFVKLMGPGHLAMKASVLLLIAVTAFFRVTVVPDRVNSDARIEGAIQRAITAPFDGFIASSDVRAGDLVSMGDLLARLDDRELILERFRLAAELGLQRIEYDRAVAARDRSETAVRRNQIAQAEAQISLVDQQIDRTRIVAPFDGVLASGDLSQSIGASVSRGEMLMTLVPQGDFRVVLQVDETRVSEVAVGQDAALVVTALPERSFALQIGKVTPVASYSDGKTWFRVDATLSQGADGLQPGMEGIAKIDVGERHLIAIWMRPLIDWWRVTAWRWLGWQAVSR
jgi:RND family efflux transporter MFP subunit